MGPPKSNESQVASPANGHDATGNTSPAIRHKMKQYWKVYSPSIESMMLSHDAPQLAGDEQREVMNYLPQRAYAGKKVLELGAGIGRYTSLLCDAGAGHVIAVDFMESYTKENQRINGHRDNATMLCADVTKLNFQPQSFDLIFSNWLLMYLTNKEVDSLLQRALAWLRPGGYLFVRESCYHQSGNLKRQENPTLYRSPLEYASIISCARAEGARYRILKTKNLVTYIKHNRNPNQLCFVARQEPDTSTDAASAVDHSSRVAETSALTDMALQRIMLREAIRGKTWCSEGGKDVAEVLASRSGCVDGKSVLDLNCGSAGLAFHLAKQGATRVHGIAATPEQLHFALRHQGTAEGDTLTKTSFEVCPEVEWSSGERFDLVCANMNSTTDAAFSHYKSLLKEGGKLVMSTYTSTSSTAEELPSSDNIQSAAHKAGFTGLTLLHSAAMLEALTNELTALRNALSNGDDDDTSLICDVPHTLRQEYVDELTEKVLQLSDRTMSWSIIEATV